MTMKRYNYSEVQGNPTNDILASGTLVVDNDNQLRIHDGSTNGGNVIGDYNNLINKPTIPSDVNQLTDADGLLGGGGGNGLAPIVTINQDDNVQITSNIVFVTEEVAASGLVFTITDPDHNNDAYFQASTAGNDGVMYNVGYYYGGNNYALVYAVDTDGTVKWETSINQINGSTPRPNCVVFRDGYVFVGFTYYDGNQWQPAVLKLNSNDGSEYSHWLLSSPSNSYPSIKDIAADNNGDPIVVGRIDGERDYAEGIVAQTGSGVDVLVVNTSDILPVGDTNVNNINWEIDTTGNGDWVGPSTINEFYNLPTVSVDGAGTGLTINLRYSGGKVTYAWINQSGTGYSNLGRGNFTFGEQVKILGSSYGGVDGVNDLVFYIWTYGGGDVWTIVAPQQDWSLSGDTPTDKTYFGMSGGVDYSQAGPWNIRHSVNGQAYIWTPNWQHTYGSGAEYEEFTSVSQNTNNGDIYVGGNFYMGAPRRSNAVYKLDSNGNTIWAKYVEDSNSLGGQSFGTIALDGSGDYLFVITQNNDDYAYVTKLDTSNGSVVWAVKQTNRDGSNYWNNEPRGEVDGNGDVYVTGSWTWNDNQYGLSITKLSGNDGGVVWARKLNTTDGQSLYEFYNDDTQPFKIVGNNIYYAGNTYDSSGNRNIGYAVVLPIDGTGTGTYGRWLYEEDTSVGYSSVDVILGTEGAFSATDGTSLSVDTDTYLGTSSNDYDNLVSAAQLFTPASGGTIEQVESITFADGSVQNTAAGGAITWTNPNSNVWRIEEYNGGAAVQYWGNDYDAKWFDVANAPSGSNNFRGAIIQYHAFIQNLGTIIGTIHLANDYSVQGATHTEHLSGNSDLQFVTLWDGNNEYGQLFFKMTNGNNWSAMIQWKATIFYGSENNC